MSKPKAPVNEKKAEFDTALRTFVVAIKESMDAAKICSMLAITHYADTGNLNWCQKFLDAMPKNFTRRAAFLKWMAAHSPITFTDGKFKKDKGDKAVEFDIEGAGKKSFWEFAPALEDIVLTDEDAFKKLMQSVKYFRRNSVKTSDKIKACVNEIEAVVNNAEAAKQAATA